MVLNRGGLLNRTEDRTERTRLLDLAMAFTDTRTDLPRWTVTANTLAEYMDVTARGARKFLSGLPRRSVDVRKLPATRTVTAPPDFYMNELDAPEELLNMDQFSDRHHRLEAYRTGKPVEVVDMARPENIEGIDGRTTIYGVPRQPVGGSSHRLKLTLLLKRYAMALAREDSGETYSIKRAVAFSQRHGFPIIRNAQVLFSEEGDPRFRLFALDPETQPSVPPKF